MSDKPNRSEQIGDALARSLDPEADVAKRMIWRRLAGVFDGVFDPKPIDILADPTVTEAYMPDGRWCWAKTCAWQIDPATGLPVALWVKESDASKDWVRIWPAVGMDDHLVKARNADATTVGGLMEKTIDSDTITRTLVTDPADSNVEKVQLNAVATRPEKIRYYLSDTHGTGDYTGHLLLTENPYPLEANAIDYEEASEWAVFVSVPGSPGLAVWQGGTLHAHLRVKLINARFSPYYTYSYKLYTGNGDIVYTDMIWDYTHRDRYQVVESAPTQPTITPDYVDLDFDIPVSALAAGADGRLGLNMRLRVYIDGDETTFDGEKIVIRIGGDDASYIDTLFTPDGGFSGVHNDLDGREVVNCHPMSAITPGRILTPSNAMVTTVDGMFAVPTNTNYVELDGTEDLIGCSTAGWIGTNSEFEIYCFAGRNILKAQSPLPDGYASFAWGAGDTGYFADYDVISARANSVFRFRLIGGNWRLCSMMNV